jgi:hypothetical protein
MAKKDDWTTCGSCTLEFRVISENHETVGFCPYCGYELDDEPLAEDEEWD